MAPSGNVEPILVLLFQGSFGNTSAKVILDERQEHMLFHIIFRPAVVDLVLPAIFGIGPTELLIVGVLCIAPALLGLGVGTFFIVKALRSPRSDHAAENLIPCPDCRRMVSRLAQACPGCGRPLTHS